MQSEVTTMFQITKKVKEMNYVKPPKLQKKLNECDVTNSNCFEHKLSKMVNKQTSAIKSLRMPEKQRDTSYITHGLNVIQ